MSAPMCVYDNHNVATSFYGQGSTQIALCPQHEEEVKGNPQKSQFLFPIAAYEDYNLPGYIERLTMRMAMREIAMEELRANLKCVDSCLEELSGEVEHIIWQVTSYSAGKVKELKAFRDSLAREIEECCRELDATHFLDSPQVENRLARVVRTYQPEKRQLVLFQYCVDHHNWPTDVDDILRYQILPPRSDPSVFQPLATRSSSLKGRVAELSSENERLQADVKLLQEQLQAMDDEKRNCQDHAYYSESAHEQRSQPPTPHLATTPETDLKDPVSYTLPILSSNILHCYNIQTGKQLTISYKTSFECGAFACMFSSDSLVCGSGSESYLLTLSSRSLFRLRAMAVSRRFAGVINYLSRIYVFGGHLQSPSCQVLANMKDQWSPLPDMSRPRSAFTPCAYEGEIFLFSSEAPLEVFRVDTQQYRSLSVTNPFEGATVAFIADCTLFVIGKDREQSKRGVGTWLIESEQGLKVVDVSGQDKLAFTTCFPPVQANGCVYWAEGQAFMFEICSFKAQIADFNSK